MSVDTPPVFVVARFREDLAWLSDASAERRCIVYDKSGDDGPPSRLAPALEWVPVPNVGRESETWLRYIITHYDALPDVVCFLQGNPKEHVSPAHASLFARLLSGDHSPVATAPLCCPLHVERDGVCVSHDEYYSHLFAGPRPPSYGFAAGAQYSVTRADLLSRPVSFYRLLHRMLSRNTILAYTGKIPFAHGVIDPWTLERLWPFVFSGAPPLSRWAQDAIRGDAAIP